jgi:hypothetical protein
MALRLGYTQRLSFSYSIPYINSNQHSGLSFGFAYSRNHQTSIETFDNKLFYYKDDELFSRKQISGSVEYTYRNGLYQTHYASAGFVHTEIEDTIALLNPDFFGRGKTSQQYFVLRYLCKEEHRDLIAYPLHGYEYDVEFSKNGLPFMNDDVNFSVVTSNVRKYWQLFPRWYFASSIRAKMTDDNYQPYYNTRALGYGRDNVRGYEYYVVDGQRFVLAKTNLKFELLPRHEFHTAFIPLEKFSTVPYAFYLNLYSDAAYAEDNQFYKYNPLTNKWLFGFGGGIDFVTYYDLVLRLEYSINKFGESGIFVHFSAPI